MNPLLSVKGTIAIGFVLAFVVAFGFGNGLNGLNAVVWLHVLAGVCWIGLLYYFNFVQGEYFKEAEPGAKGDAVKKV